MVSAPPPLPAAPSDRSPGPSPEALAVRSALGRLPDPLLGTWRLTETQLGKALNGMFEKADDALFDFAEKAGASSGDASQSAFFECFREMRRRKASMEESFLNGLAEAFVRWHQALDPSLARSPAAESPLSLELSLVDDDVLEEDLALDAMVARAEGALKQELHAFEQRLKAMGGDEDRPNPLAPRVVAQAFRHALSPLVTIEPGAKLVVYKIFDREVVHHLPGLYQAANADLARAGILPTLRLAPVRQAGAGPSASSGGGGAPGGGYADSAAPASHSLFQAGEQVETFDLNAMGGEGVMSGGGGAPMGLPQAGVGVQPFYGGAGSGGAASGGEAANALWQTVQALLVQRQPQQQALLGAPSIDGELLAGPPSSYAPPIPLQDLLGALGQLRRQAPLASAPEDALDLKRLLKVFLEKAEGDRHHADDHAPSSLPTLGAHESAIDLIGMLFEFILSDHALPAPVQAALARLQIPYLKAAVLEPDLFGQAHHPARRLLNALADAGKGYSTKDTGAVVLSAIEDVVLEVVDRFEHDPAVFADQYEKFQNVLNAMKARSERSEKRTADAATGKERMAKARQVAVQILVEALAPEEIPEDLRVMMTKAWSHYMVVCWLREGEESEKFEQTKRFAQAMGAIATMTPDDPRSADVWTDAPTMLTLWAEGLAFVGLSELEIDPWVHRLRAFFSQHLTHAPVLEVRDLPSPLGSDQPDLVAETPLEPEPVVTTVHPRVASAEKIVAALALGQWVQWGHGDDAKRGKLSWVGGFTGKMLFVNAHGLKVLETTKKLLAVDLAQGSARVVADQPLVERAMSSIASRLRAHQAHEGDHGSV